MQMEKEITVLVKTDYETLKKELEKNNFVKKDEYQVNDIYMINDNLDLLSMSYLDILKRCILVRDVVGYEKLLLYKYKEYASNGDILKQGKVKCPVEDTLKAVNFLEAIHYRKLFNIFDTCIVYANESTELVVELVNDKYIFIELEDKCEYIDKDYNDIESMKEEILKYNLPIYTSNFFVKKAEIMLKEILEK